MSNKIEEIKRAKDGLDVLEDIYRYADLGFDAIPADDLDRMKWYGLFHRSQTPGFFMMRLRITSGILRSDQARQLGTIINRFGRGMADLTTRQNLQFRWLRIEDVPQIFAMLQDVGIEYRQSGMDNVRNITGCPLAGLHPDELLDASPVALAVQQAIIGLKDYSNLPRKFNISISGCPDDCATSQIHDIGLSPAIRDGVIGFNVKVGGAMGGKSPRYATDLDVFITPEQAPLLCTTILSIFRDEGLRESRLRARLKWLLDDWGMERFRDEVQQRLGLLEPAGYDAVTTYASDHIGVRRQKQDGLSAVGVSIPVGRISGDDLIEFAELATNFGSGELRLTNDQNLLIVNVPQQKLDALLATDLLQRYSPEPGSWMRRTVSCTGTDYCHFSLIDTKEAAVDLARSMEAMALSGSPLRVHWSGCPHACGQHQIGDVGLLGSRIRVGDKIIEAADIFLAGKPGPEPQLAEMVQSNVPLSELPQRLAALLAARQAQG